MKSSINKCLLIKHRKMMSPLKTPPYRWQYRVCVCVCVCVCCVVLTSIKGPGGTPHQLSNKMVVIILRPHLVW
jgi:hypothetical protein